MPREPLRRTLLAGKRLYRLIGGGHADNLLAAVRGCCGPRSARKSPFALLLSHVTHAAASILKTNNRPEWTGCHPNLTKMKPPRGVGPPGGMYRVDPWLSRSAGGAVQLLTTAVQLLFASIEADSALGVFRWFEVAHFNDFFLSSHTVYLFRFVCCWLMSVAPKSS